jgi:hypothetical protein
MSERNVICNAGDASQEQAWRENDAARPGDISNNLRRKNTNLSPLDGEVCYADVATGG